MLPVENFIRSNFIDGIKFNPEQIQLNDKYFDEKFGLATSYGIGKGILVGFKSSLRVIIENEKLVLKSGALIDAEGNILFVNKEHIILENIANKQFESKKSIYVYLKYETRFEDLQESRHDKDVKLHYKIVDSYQVLVQEKSFRDKSLTEVARIFIDYKTSANIKMPINPFDPSSNEVDIRFAPKIVAKNHIVSSDEKILVSSILRKYANFLNELGFRNKIMTASQTASFAYAITANVKSFDITPWQLYDMLYELLNISLQVYNEKTEIVNTGFWKNIKRLQSIFAFSENYEVDYYSALLDIDSSFFSKVILHFSNAAVFDGDWDAILDDKEATVEKVDKGYLVAGTAQSCEIVMEGEDIASEHAKLYPFKGGYLIEDMFDTSGVYINAEKLEKGVKKFIRAQDYIVLGKTGKILNLHNL